MIGLWGVLSGYVMLNADGLKLFTRAALTTMVKKIFKDSIELNLCIGFGG